MDRGVPTEAVLQAMRNCDSPVQYLVGTPKGRLARWRKRCLPSRGRRSGPGVDVKLLLQESELYVQTQSRESGGERAGDAAAGPAILPISSIIWQQTAKPTRHPAEEHQAVVQRCYEKRFHRASSAAPRA